ncbi:MAG TPA: helicase C-terminal domain-containing protein, partial [Thermodesulfobacteriota bacterium]|nr:helicase C-terminal domain-containing protein [Thermodesulfobacteriota bacterium]
QEQLFFKDVPFVQKELNFPFRAAFMKGRGNYLCLRRFRLFSARPLFKTPEEAAHYPILRKWSLATRSGDRAELTDLPEDLPVWKEICASSETCVGQACDHLEQCFIMRMRQEAASSDVVIVNHHLFFADLAVRAGGYGEVLPRYEAVIFDEAHQLEDVATQYLGKNVSSFRFEELARDVVREAAAAKSKDPIWSNLAGDLLKRQEIFFSPLRGTETRYRVQKKDFTPKGAESAARLMDSLDLLSAHVDGMKEAAEGLRSLGRRAKELKSHFEEILSLSDPARVYWCETRGRGVFLHYSPIDISPDLQAHLYTRLKTAVFVSATLSTQGNFRFSRDRLGLKDALLDEKILDSSFDMARQALFYLPTGLPDPNTPSFLPAAAEEIAKVLEATRGRAFLLFTSVKNMEEAYSMLKGRLPFTSFIQGEKPKTALIQAFREDIHSVLFATASFWEGVDVRGEALSCVIIDRLPFSRPNEPIMESRLERISASGGNAFRDYQVPEAILLLKQGIGRLIRTRQDRGILVILDSRLTTRAYGKMFLESLPSCPIVRDLDSVLGFFREEIQRKG